MSWLTDFFRSALGKKTVMAVTGIVLFGFVLGHMAGNMKLYLGDDLASGEPKINVYAEGLRELGAPVLGHGQALWIARFGLLAAVGLHILAAYQLTMLNRKARPRGYAQFTPEASSYASRTMRYGGVIILLFIVYHLLHLTSGTLHSDFVEGDVYRNLVVGFSNPLVSGFYILAQVALGFHLYHGLWSMLQTLGWNGPRINPLRQKAAAAFAILISLGNISFPISVLAGLVKLGA